jgi:hypothetical protein
MWIRKIMRTIDNFTKKSIFASIFQGETAFFFSQRGKRKKPKCETLVKKTTKKSVSQRKRRLKNRQFPQKHAKK